MSTTTDRFKNEKSTAISYIQNIIPDSIFRENFEYALDMLIIKQDQGPIFRQLNKLADVIENGGYQMGGSRMNSYREIVTSINNIISQLHSQNQAQGIRTEIDLIR